MSVRVHFFQFKHTQLQLRVLQIMSGKVGRRSPAKGRKSQQRPETKTEPAAVSDAGAGSVEIAKDFTQEEVTFNYSHYIWIAILLFLICWQASDIILEVKNAPFIWTLHFITFAKRSAFMLVTTYLIIYFASINLNLSQVLLTNCLK